MDQSHGRFSHSLLRQSSRIPTSPPWTYLHPLSYSCFFLSYPKTFTYCIYRYSLIILSILNFQMLPLNNSAGLIFNCSASFHFNTSLQYINTGGIMIFLVGLFFSFSFFDSAVLPFLCFYLSWYAPVLPYIVPSLISPSTVPSLHNTAPKNLNSITFSNFL